MDSPPDSARGRRDRLAGLLGFAFIPATLLLMLRMPLGQGKSLLLAAAIIALHRQFASRFVYARGQHRCLWCGGPPRQPQPVQLAAVPALAVCTTESSALDRFLGFCAAHALALRVGILGPVAAYFALGLLAGAGVEPLPLELRQHLFRGLIAAAVVAVAVLHRWHLPRRPASFPFPVHNLALLGVRWTLWVFLVVGVCWLWITARWAL